MLTIEVWTILAHPLFLDQLEPRAEGEAMTDEQAIEAVKKYLNELERQLTEY
jgi:hypothetical protein